MAELPPDQMSLLGIKLVHFVAGLLGGAVRAITRPDLSWGRKLGTGFAGAVVSGYGTPVAAPVAWLYANKLGVDISPDEIAGLVGFVLGMTGLTIADGLVRWAQDWRRNPTFPPRPPWRSSGK
jgi:hypothetical protein